MFKAIIFDLDGTVLDTSEDLTNAVNQTRKEFHLTPVTKEKVLESLGNGFVVLMNKAIPEIDSDKTLPIFKEKYAECYLDKTEPYTGITAMLKELNKRRILIAVNSNKDDLYSKKLIEKNFPDIEFIDVVGTIPERKRKPDPEGVNFILSKMKVTKEEAVYCGDSDVDIITAKNAGLTSISCTWGFRGKEELILKGAEHLVDQPEELLTYFQ